jgi:hypothetical protein
MDFQEILDALEQLLDQVENLDELQDLWERIQRMREGVPPGGQPDPGEFARLLADILRAIPDNAPIPDKLKKLLDKIIDAIEAIVQSNVNLTLETLWERYKRLREAGFSHEEAIEQISLDPIVRAWLLLRWLEEQKGIEDEEGDGEEGGVEEEPEETDDPVIVVRQGPRWAFRDNECCADPPAGRGGGRIVPTITAGPPAWTPAPAPFNGKNLNLKIDVTHQCGLESTRVRAWVRAPSGWIELERTPTPGLGGFEVKRSGEWNDPTRKLQLRIIATGEVAIVVTATSRCFTKALQRFNFVVP